MQQLVFGLYAEGRTDQRFFIDFLQRYVSEVCVAKGIELEILPPIPIDKNQGTFIEQMRQVERDYEGLQLIFVHNDADARNPGEVRRYKWQPWISQCKESDRWLPIIPVRMLESWLLADVEALVRTFNVDIAVIDDVLGSIYPESIVDPKGVLAHIKSEGKQRKIFGFEEVLAKRLRFSELQRLSSFRKFADDVEGWLQHFA